jgi:hypothetical protein
MLYQGEVPGGCCPGDYHPVSRIAHRRMAAGLLPCVSHALRMLGYGIVRFTPSGIQQAFYTFSEDIFLASGASKYFASSKRVLVLRQR